MTEEKNAQKLATEDFDNEFDNTETLSSESGETTKTTVHPTIDDAPHVVTAKELETISGSVKFLAGVCKGFTKMFCDDDGMLIDLTDKAGQKQMRELMLNVCARTEKAQAEIESSLRQHYTAEFQPEDKKLLQSLSKNFRDTRYWVFGSCLVGALFLTIGLVLSIKSSFQIKQMEEQQRQQAEMVSFGSYVKDHAPKVYTEWQQSRPSERANSKGKENKSVH